MATTPRCPINSINSAVPCNQHFSIKPLAEHLYRRTVRPRRNNKSNQRGWHQAMPDRSPTIRAIAIAHTHPCHPASIYAPYACPRVVQTTRLTRAYPCVEQHPCVRTAPARPGARARAWTAPARPSASERRTTRDLTADPARPTGDRTAAGAASLGRRGGNVWA